MQASCSELTLINNYSWNMVQTLMMKHALSNLENQIVEVNGGGQNSEARPCHCQTILTIKFTGQIYEYFLWLQKFTCTFYDQKKFVLHTYQY